VSSGGIVSIRAAIRFASSRLSVGSRVFFMATTVWIVSGTKYEHPSGMAPKLRPEADQPTLYGVKLKIGRANEHLANIEKIVDAFGTSHRIVREPEADGVHEVVKLVVASVPEMLPIIVSEAVFHLRSALDNLAVSLVPAGGNTKTTYFPIANCRQEFELPETQRKIKALPPRAQKAIHRLKPYKGGNDLLWAMNRLRNNNTHLRLLPIARIGPHWNSPTITTLIPAISGAMIEINYPQTFINELVLARCSHGAKVEYDAQPAVGIAFSDVEFLKGESVVTRVRQMVNLTERIVQIFERYFF
jgi:hypothetical protein